MKNLFLRILIIAPFIAITSYFIKQEITKNERHPNPQVLGSSIIFTVGDSGITCTTITETINPATGQKGEIDGVTIKGSPLGAEITYKTECFNTGQTELTNVSLTNNLSGQNQNYLTFKDTPDSDCNLTGSIFSCNIGLITLGGSVIRQLNLTTTSEVPSVTQVTNNTVITTGEGLTANIQNEFNIYPRPLCIALGPPQNPIRVADNTAITFTASSTTYDGVPPTYIYNFNDGSQNQTVTTNQSSVAHTFNRVGGETESTYFAYLRVVDSLGNATGDAANCSADCSKIIKVSVPSESLYCSCSNNTPSCVTGFGGQTCQTAADCDCGFYCDQSSLTVTPLVGKSPLTVSVKVTASGTAVSPLTYKFYDGSTLIKQSTSNLKTITEQLDFSNSSQNIQAHNLNIVINDVTGKVSGSSCTAAIAVQPGGSGHYECQSNRCVYSSATGSNSCGVDADCGSGSPITCNLTAEPGSGVSPLTVTLQATCTGGTPPYVDYFFDFGCEEGDVNLGTNTTTHTYNQNGYCEAGVKGTDSAGAVSPRAPANIAITTKQATESADFHLECQATTGACEAVDGEGSDTCKTALDCKLPPTTPKHFVCNKVRKTCEAYFGYGKNTCNTHSDCQQLKNGFVFPTVIITIIAGSLLTIGSVLIINNKHHYGK